MLLGVKLSSTLIASREVAHGYMSLSKNNDSRDLRAFQYVLFIDFEINLELFHILAGSTSANGIQMSPFKCLFCVSRNYDTPSGIELHSADINMEYSLIVD